jgi:hypothetical protein
MTKDQYKESCGRIGVPYFEHEFNEKMQDYIKSIQANTEGYKEAASNPLLFDEPVKGVYKDSEGDYVYFRGIFNGEDNIRLDYIRNTSLDTALELMTDQPEDYDVVGKPKHYMLFENIGIEVRDVIEKLVAKVDKQMGEGVVPYSPLFSSDYTQMMQYGMRFMEKNGKEDLEKMQQYLQWLIDAYDRAS